MASEVNQLRQSFIRTPRAFRNGMTLAYWIKIEVSRASRSFESDLTRFSEKVEASRTASFRGQEIFLMVSGDVPRYTKEVLRGKKSNFFFDFVAFVPDFKDFTSSFIFLILDYGIPFWLGGSLNKRGKWRWVWTESRRVR